MPRQNGRIITSKRRIHKKRHGTAYAIVILSCVRGKIRQMIDTMPTIRRLLISVTCVMALCMSSSVFAGNLITDDPKGFDGIPWGSSLSEREDFQLVDNAGDVKGYDRKEGPLPLGKTTVDSMRYLTIGDKFARVTIRYHGKETHTQLLAYLQSQYGQLDRTPGQMVRGLNQQFNWRGTDTEINMTYEAQGDRGYVFFDSRVLSPRFNDNIADNAY